MPLNINASPARQPKQRELVEEGTQMARLVQVIDLGLQPQRPYQGKEKPPAFEMRLTFEFPNSRIDVDGESKPMWKSVNLKLSSHELSKCYKWYTKLDPQGKHRGDWSKLIGAPVFVLITHSPGKGKNAHITYDNVSDVNLPMKGMEVPPLENDPVVFDLTSPNLDVFNAFPDWLKEIIQSNLEYDGSKLQRAVEGTGTMYTARTEGDAPEEQDSDEPTHNAPVAEEEDDGEEPW